MEKIKKFLWPNRGVLGIFLVWAAFVLLALAMNLMPIYIFLDWTIILRAAVINLAIVYLLSCLSVLAYEKFKGRAEARKRRR